MPELAYSYDEPITQINHPFARMVEYVCRQVVPVMISTAMQEGQIEKGKVVLCAADLSDWVCVTEQTPVSCGEFQAGQCGILPRLTYVLADDNGELREFQIIYDPRKPKAKSAPECQWSLIEMERGLRV
jgi:hypothetical protein